MPSDIVISGTLLNGENDPARGVRLFITPLSVAGAAIHDAGFYTPRSDLTGAVSFTLIQGVTYNIKGPVLGFNSTGGTDITMPSEATATVESLIAVASIPSAGLTLKLNDVALPTLIGTLNVTGDGAVITQTAPGVAELEFTAGAGGGNHNLLSATHPDSTAAAVVRGDVITGQGATPKWARLAKGASGTYLRSDGTDLLYSAIQAGDLPNLSAVYEPANANIQAHIASTSNPHSVTKAQVGLANVDNVQQQPLHADLTALAALSSTGFVNRTGAGAFTAAALVAGDIPSLDAAKITSGQFADARIASAGVWNAKQDALGFTAENAANKNQAGGYAGLDGSSKLNPSHLPAIAISNYLGSVASQAAMLALTGERGDWAIRSDENKTYIIIGDDPTQLADWQAIATPTDLVSSVFGRTGVVTAQANDYNFNQLAGTVALNQLHTDVLIASDIGVSVQAQSDILSDLAGLTQAGDKLPYFSSASAMALADFTSFGRSLIDDVDAAAGRSTLGVVIGTDVQAFSARLSEVASIGSSLQQLRVNSGGTALEYFTPGAGGSQTPWTSNIDADGFNLLFDDATGIKSSEAGNPELLLFSSVASAVNELTVTNAATGSPPIVSATGGDTNISLEFLAKGTGLYKFGGTSSAFPAFLPFGNFAIMKLRAADDSGYGIHFATSFVAVDSSSNQHAAVEDDAGIGKVILASGGQIHFTSAGNIGGVHTGDVGLTRPAAGVLRLSDGSTGKGSLLIGSSSASVGTSGVGVLVLENGTPPASSPANCVQLYAEDVAASSELKVRDEAGNITVLGPHSWKRIPEGPSEEMAWSFYSERGDRYISVDMARMIRLVEKLSGEQLIYTGKVN